MAATHPGALRLVTLNFWGIEPPLDKRLALAESQLRGLEHGQVLERLLARPARVQGLAGRRAELRGETDVVGPAARAGQRASGG